MQLFRTNEKQRKKGVGVNQFDKKKMEAPMIQWVFLERNGLLMLRVKLSYHHETK
jgi:hypothetical protein